MCGIDFVMAVTDREATKAEEYVHFDEKLQQHLLKEFGMDRSFDLLLNLNLYGTDIIYTKDIPKLIKICDKLFGEYDSVYGAEQEIRNFVKELKNMCEEALKLKKHLYAIGE